MIFLSLMLACPKQVEPVVDMAPPVSTVDRSKPGPLESSNFTLPVIQTGTLSNGMKVVVVENHELPVVQVRAVFNTGSWTDKAKHEGLASVAAYLAKPEEEPSQTATHDDALRAF